MTLTRWLYSAEEAAEMFGISTAQVYRMFADGSLPFVVIGRRKMVSADALSEFVNRNSVRNAAGK